MRHGDSQVQVKFPDIFQIHDSNVPHAVVTHVIHTKSIEMKLMIQWSNAMHQ